MKYFFIILFFLTNINLSHSAQKDRAYFAGGCFWCVEESFEKLNGVEEVISGYSGGKTENPTYKEVTYGNSGHFEVVEIIYDKEIISYKELLKNFWINIDPFDAYGQFCDKGYSYRSVAFYQNQNEKKDFMNFSFDHETFSGNNKSPLNVDEYAVNKKVLSDDIKMMHEFIEFKYFKKVMKRNNNIIE